MRSIFFIFASMLALTACPATQSPTDTNVSTNCTTFWRDADGDGYGDPNEEGECLEQTALPGYAPNDRDCEDGNAAVNPGATELCDDSVDNNCDGEVDEGCPEEPACQDVDGDGFCLGQSSDPEADCDDFNSEVNPAAVEDCANGVDDDCNGLTDTEDSVCVGGVIPVDADGDGHNEDVDCNDAEPSIYPGATERCNGVDDDCDGQIDEGCPGTTPGIVDADGDGYTSAIDCDDNDRNINPGATEVCNGKDDDCDGQIDEGCPSTTPTPTDADGDGHSASADCDDSNAAIYPGATEVCNGVDDDCDGQVDEGAALLNWYADADGDGYGDPANKVQACQKPSGYVSNSTDCNDTAPSVKPGGVEICNGVDDDCDHQIDENVGTTWYRDADGDGYGTVHDTKVACAKPAGYVAQGGDCDDSLNASYPGAREVCNDGEDNNCNGLTDGDDRSSCLYGDGIVRLCMRTAPLKAAGVSALWTYARKKDDDGRWFEWTGNNHPFIIGHENLQATPHAELCSSSTPADVARFGLLGGTDLAAGDWDEVFFAGFCTGPGLSGKLVDNGKICGKVALSDVVSIRSGNQVCEIKTVAHNKPGTDYHAWGSTAQSIACR